MTWEEAVLWLKSQPNKQDLVKSCFFDDPIIECVKRYYDSTEWQEIKKLISKLKKGKVLDVGAGRGISSYAFAKDGWAVSALEPDKSIYVGSGAIKGIIKKAKLNNITIMEEWGENLPFNDNSYDLIYARQVLHHATDLNGMCKEFYRVLKPGGFFLFTREHVINNKNNLKTFLSAHPLHRLYGGENAYTLKEYKIAIRNSGLCIIKILKPFDSDINLFPLSKDDIKRKVIKKLKINIPNRMIKFIFFIMNITINTPGRLYSFWGKK